MVRTFHHKITVGAVCGIIVLLLLSLYAFWTKAVVVGLCLAVGLLLVAERTMHSEYTLRDGLLVIHRGRLSKDRTIDVSLITSCRPMATTFGLVRYLLITYGADGRMEAVQPKNEKAFVEALIKSKKSKEDKEDNEDED